MRSIVFTFVMRKSVTKTQLRHVMNQIIEAHIIKWRKSVNF